MKEEMTARERVFAAFRRLPYDRMPVINPVSIVIFESMKHTGCFFPQAHYDVEKMALLAAAGYDFMGFDCISPYFSICNEVAALGCKVDWGSPSLLPSISSHINYNELNVKPDGEYISKKPVRTIIEAIIQLRKNYGTEVAIIGKAIGPWTLSFLLFGVQKILTNLVLDFNGTRELICLLKEYVLKFIEAQLEAGADIITISDDAVGNFISLGGYSKLILPLHKEINKLIHQAGAYSIIHLSGIVLDKLRIFVDAGFDAINPDSKNPFPILKETIGNNMLVCGCLNILQVLLNGTSEDVILEVLYYLNNGIDILAPEGMLTLGVPSKNLKSIFKGLRKYYMRKM